jgi:hypothetical protein
MVVKTRGKQGYIGLNKMDGWRSLSGETISCRVLVVIALSRSTALRLVRHPHVMKDNLEVIFEFIFSYSLDIIRICAKFSTCLGKDALGTFLS